MDANKLHILGGIKHTMRIPSHLIPLHISITYGFDTSLHIRTTSFITSQYLNPQSLIPRSISVPPLIQHPSSYRYPSYSIHLYDTLWLYTPAMKPLSFNIPLCIDTREHDRVGWMHSPTPHIGPDACPAAWRGRCIEGNESPADSKNTWSTQKTIKKQAWEPLGTEWKTTLETTLRTWCEYGGQVSGLREPKTTRMWMSMQTLWHLNNSSKVMIQT